MNSEMQKFILGFGAVKLRFSEMSIPEQLAMIHYMALDGEAWDIEDNIYIKDIHRYIRKNRLYYVKKYGKSFFWRVNIPTLEAIKKVFEELSESSDDFKTWQDYHKWYLTAGCHNHSKRNRWPCILSSNLGEDENLFQDGWHRFHCYVRQNSRNIPCIGYA